MSGDVICEHLAWMQLRGLSPKSILHRSKVLRLVEGEFGDLLEADRRALAGWQRAHADLAAQSMCSYVSQRRMFYRWCVEEKLLDVDPSTRATGSRPGCTGPLWICGTRRRCSGTRRR